MTMRVPDINDTELVFGSIKHMPRYDELPSEFRDWTCNEWCRAISSWFHRGCKTAPRGIEIDGHIYSAKADVDHKKALAAINAILRSWSPKHEHKIAGCGFLLHEWFDKAPSKSAA